MSPGLMIIMYSVNYDTVAMQRPTSLLAYQTPELFADCSPGYAVMRICAQLITP
jgi:hypothetical protein